jgi:hypothetical protein
MSTYDKLVTMTWLWIWTIYLDYDSLYIVINKYQHLFVNFNYVQQSNLG